MMPDAIKSAVRIPRCRTLLRGRHRSPWTRRPQIDICQPKCHNNATNAKHAHPCSPGNGLRPKRVLVSLRQVPRSGPTREGFGPRWQKRLIRCFAVSWSPEVTRSRDTNSPFEELESSDGLLQGVGSETLPGPGFLARRALAQKSTGSTRDSIMLQPVLNRSQSRSRGTAVCMKRLAES